MEDSESRFEEQLKELEDQPSYMYASWEKFCKHPTDIGAKYLWLKYTRSNETLPDNVFQRMIKAIENDIKNHEKQRSRSCVLEEPYTRKSEICMLLDFALNDIEYLRQVLHSPKEELNIKDQLLVVHFGDDLLQSVREAFPYKNKPRKKDLYDFFGRQLGYEDQKQGESLANRMRRIYQHYLRKKEDEGLFLT
ncbi:MAG: hypothetical protein ACYSWP_19465 [Planctomycetota bacterium]|jgi:hypothetical protein